MDPKPRNILDSSAPSRRRGKEREVPKQKFTPLKKHILKEKELKENVESTLTVDLLDVSEHELSKEEKVKELLQCLVHTEKYREYCRQSITVEIHDLTSHLLSELVRFQDRLHHQNPAKAKMKRRLGFGMKEVLKYVALGKVKCLIIAPDIFKLEVLDKMTEKLIEECKEHDTPVIFALSRFLLGRVCKKRAHVSSVAVFNYDGAQDTFQALLEKVEEARSKYEEVLETTKLRLEAIDEPELDIIREEVRSENHIPNAFESLNKELFTKAKKAYSQQASKIKIEIPRPV